MPSERKGASCESHRLRSHLQKISRMDKSTRRKQIGAARAWVGEGQEWEVADPEGGFHFFSGGGGWRHLEMP